MEAEFHFSELFNLLNSEIEKAKHEIFIAVPYAKIGIVKKLDFPKNPAVKVTFICRWKLDDVLTGATDIEVYPLLRDQGIRVLLHQNLHAKYYRSDNKILMGNLY